MSPSLHDLSVQVFCYHLHLGSSPCSFLFTSIISLKLYREIKFWNTFESISKVFLKTNLKKNLAKTIVFTTILNGSCNIFIHQWILHSTEWTRNCWVQWKFSITFFVVLKLLFCFAVESSYWGLQEAGSLCVTEEYISPDWQSRRWTVLDKEGWNWAKSC